MDGMTSQRAIDWMQDNVVTDVTYPCLKSAENCVFKTCLADPPNDRWEGLINGPTNGTTLLQRCEDASKEEYWKSFEYKFMINMMVNDFMDLFSN